MTKQGTKAERLAHRLAYLRQNWDDPDVQFNISLGNYEAMDKYVDESMGLTYNPKPPKKQPQSTPLMSAPGPKLGLIEQTQIAESKLQIIDVDEPKKEE